MIVLFFVLGAVLASFYTCLALRLPNDISIIKGRSYCDNCHTTLKALDLIPIFSYIFLGGKCRYCKNKIPIVNLLSEISLGVVFALGYHLYGFSYELYAYLIIASLVLIIFVSDFKYLVILDFPLYICVILILVLKFIYFGLNGFINALISGVVLVLFLLIIKLVGDKVFKRESLGWGDVKLASFMGVVLGIRLGLTSLVLGSFIALPYAIYYVIKKQEKEIPFGPFLILSVFILFVFMDQFDYVIKVLFMIK